MKSTKNKALLFWNKQEPTIEAMMLTSNLNHLDEDEREEVISYLPDLEGKKVVDLAAGIGRFTSHFASKAQHVTAVDFTPQFIEKNRQDHVDYKNITFVCASVMDVQFPEHSLDFVFCNWLLMYLKDEEAELLIQRIHRWLIPGGELFFRESCALSRCSSPIQDYFANYRTLSEYDALVKQNFHLIKRRALQHICEPFF